MKNSTQITFGFLAIIIIWAGILYWQDIKSPSEEIIFEHNEVVGVEETKPDGIEMCFIYNTEAGDKANIVMNIKGEYVEGEFNWIPFEKDKKIGKFSGVIGDVDPYTATRNLDAVWNASAEGVLVKEQLKIIVGEGIASPGFGAMSDRGDGVYVYTDLENIVFGPNLSLTSCDDEALK